MNILYNINQITTVNKILTGNQNILCCFLIVNKTKHKIKKELHSPISRIGFFVSPPTFSFSEWYIQSSDFKVLFPSLPPGSTLESVVSESQVHELAVMQFVYV